MIACSSPANGPADSSNPVIRHDGAVDGTAIVDGTPIVDGTVVVDSAAIVDGIAIVDGVATVDGAAMVDGAPMIDGSVVVDGAAPDAAPPAVDAMPGVDAGSTPNTVSCYSQGAPDATCDLPTHCCFSNFDSHHNGACQTAACTWGTISCDGPEDCAGGQRCCAHAIIDPDQGLEGYTLACQAAPCGPAPANQELCHPGTCSSGTCVKTLGIDNDLPRTLSICQ